MLSTVQFRSLKIVMSIVVYLHMYNLTVDASRCVSLVWSTRRSVGKAGLVGGEQLVGYF